VLLPQGVPTATATHEPSKLPPPPPEPSPPLRRDARRGSSESGLARRAGLDDSTARGFSREPDSDFSSLPMLPPALPDCARAGLGRATMASVADSRAALVRYRMMFGKIHWFPMNRVLTAGPVGTNSADNAGKIRRCRRTRQALRPRRGGYPTCHSSTPSSAVTTLPTEPTGVRSRFSKCLSVAPSLAGMRASARASPSVRIITTPCSTSPLPL